MKKLTVLLLFINFYISFSQNRILIQGQIISDSSEIDNIHIFNKNTNSGVTTNTYGKFELKVKLNDVLIFTAVQFEIVRKMIDKTDILNKNIEVKMNFFTNKLNTVNISSHNLTGKLLEDSKNIPKDFLKNNSFKLDLKGIDFEVPTNINSADDVKVADPLITSETPSLIDFVKVYKLLTKGLRKKRKAKIAFRESLKAIPLKIREELGDDFFINQLKIQRPQIEPFIIYCNAKNIFSLYNRNKMIELIEILYNESKTYLK